MKIPPRFRGGKFLCPTVFPDIVKFNIGFKGCVRDGDKVTAGLSFDDILHADKTETMIDLEQQQFVGVDAHGDPFARIFRNTDGRNTGRRGRRNTGRRGRRPLRAIKQNWQLKITAKPFL